MKKISTFVLLFVVACTTFAQTLKVHTGQVTVAVPADKADKMRYEGGTSLTIYGKTYDIAAIDSITVDRSTVPDSTVSVVYGGNTAHVLVSGDIYPNLTVTAEGADVSVIADARLLSEVTYRLSGASAAGSFMMDGEFKATLVLDGLTLTNPAGPAINIENGKRINVRLTDGTTTTLEDGAGGLHKACFFINGHPEFSGSGNLVLTGNSRHAYASDEYTYLRSDFSGNIEVKKAVSDGLHVEQYFRMRGGKVKVSGTGGDCIDVSITKDPLDVLNGQVFVEGGAIEMTVAADDVKGLKSDSLMTISGGSITALVSGLGTKGISVGTNLLINRASGNATSVNMNVTGTTYKPGDALLESKCRGIRVKGDFTFDGGDIRISATGVKSKAVKVDGVYTYKSGSINCVVEDINSI